MGITFTPAQKRVIEQRNSNILVSAAAGSGKTAVLVERIVQKVTDCKNPVDIDRLLIVTFTNAAASEMRERISDALLKKIEEFPEDEHIQKQMTLIHNAQITTIDSFCLFVIRNNFNDIGIDPGFRVADAGELQLLRKDVLAAVLERRFEAGEEAFYHCVECYSTNGKEKTLEDNIIKLYQFSISYPFPEKWLARCKEEYCLLSMDALEDAQWVRNAMEQIRLMLTDCELLIQEAMAICEQSDGPYMYNGLLEAELEWIQKASGITGFTESFYGFSGLVFGRLPSKRDDSVSKEKREIVKSMRGMVKECLTSIKETYFFVSPEQTLADLAASAPAVGMLIDLTKQFMEALAAKKQEKNIIDFSDMEHFALQILLKEEEGESIPSKTAHSFREYFEEILIDEYQDSNLVQEYLLKSISKEDQGIFNRFMVGDVKQSIYKFRLARPELFMDKYNSYEIENDNCNCQRIDLKQNFRSREEILESINYIFYQIMGKNLGGVEYDPDAALYLGANYQDTGQDNDTELLMIEKDGTEGETELSKKEQEAATIARRIKELVGHFQVTDKESGGLRAAVYKDIVILLRSNAGWDEEFRRVLTEEGIPAYITSKTGYFSSIEIQSVLNFLRILDNPLQDIPLCAVLTSPMIGFTNEELALIKALEREITGNKRECLYDSICRYKEKGENKELQEKLVDFLELLLNYRQKVAFTPIHELLYDFLDNLGFYYYMSAMPAGEQRKANMDMLLEKAIDFEKTSYHGLFHFIRYIEQMEKFEVDFGEANILDENADVVRIMSIHKSKGLEFPICIVAGMAKRFNMQDVRKPLIMDIDYGIGSDYCNPEERYKTTTLRKNVIAAKMKLENLGEELRILYVALTRAKEKLIMTGTIDDVGKKLTSLSPLLENKTETISFVRLTSMNSYLDYILAALIRHRGFAPILERYGLTPNNSNPMFGKGPEILVQVCCAEGLIAEKVKEFVRKDYLQRRLEQEDKGTVWDKQLEQMIADKFSFVYPHAVLSKLFTKTTVSELKKMGQMNQDEAGVVLYEEEEAVPYIPGFMRKAEKISGTARGSAYHRVLELLDLTQMSEQSMIETQMKELLLEGKISEEYTAAVDRKRILHFGTSLLAERMAEADKKDKLFREQPFVLGVAAHLIKPEFPEEETILVQGIIDVYFEEDGELVVADYKTDLVNSGQELWKRYRTQLDYYAEALERLTGKRVKEKIIYSFALGKEFHSS